MVSRRAALFTALLAVVAFSAAWVLYVGLPRWYRQRQAASSSTAPAPPAAAHRTIKATLFYAAPGGDKLHGVQRDVDLGQSALEQAHQILVAQIKTPPPPDLVSTIPQGASLRAVFVTERGEAFVDLSAEISSAHPGGSLNEILTVYTIVHALTANLPAIRSVQILVNGRETDTLAGHVDLRRPLQPDPKLIEGR